MEHEDQRRGKVHKSASEKELDKIDAQSKAFEDNIKEMTLDRMNEAPREETEQQTKISQREAQKSKDIYLKPVKTIFGRGEKFNEKWRKDYEFDKEYVQFIAEHKEIIGEKIEAWTKKYPGQPAEFWEVPTNKPVWGPRYLAERIKGCIYHRLRMDQSQMTSADGMGTYTGQMVSDQIVQRLDAIPVGSRRSVFV